MKIESLKFGKGLMDLVLHLNNFSLKLYVYNFVKIGAKQCNTIEYFTCKRQGSRDYTFLKRTQFGSLDNGQFDIIKIFHKHY